MTTIQDVYRKELAGKVAQGIMILGILDDFDQDAHIERTLDETYSFGYHNSGQSFLQGTPREWGVTKEDVLAALDDQNKVFESLRQPGRPLQGDEPRKARSLSLTDSEFAVLKTLGNDNASAGVSKLIAERA